MITGKTTGYIVINKNNDYYLICRMRVYFKTLYTHYNIYQYNSEEKTMKFIRQIKTSKSGRHDIFVIGYAFVEGKILDTMEEDYIMQLREELNNGKNHIEI